MNYRVCLDQLKLNQFLVTRLLRVVMAILLLIQGLMIARAQVPTAAISLTQVPDDGFLLKDGWRFQAGDVANGASPQLDDRHWSQIDPTKDIRELPQLQRAGIGWLRLHLHTGPDLPPLMIKMFQSVASEIYLDGRLLYTFGTISTNPDRVQAYNPSSAYSFPLKASTEHVLALRVACQPGLIYTTNYLHWDAGTIQFWLFPTTALPALKPVAVQAIYLATFKLGISFILFILHLSLFFTHRTKRTNLYAAGMYLMLTLALLAMAANDFTHTLSLRILVYYGSYLAVWMPGMAILTFYTMFNFRKGWLCWLAIGSIGLVFIPLPADFQWLFWPINYYLPLELIRLSLVATRRELPGARIVTSGAFANLGLMILSSVLFALHISDYGHEWLFHLFYLAAFLCFPLTLSLLLALEHGWINQQLMARLQEVENLSARNLAHQQERQQLLSQQNEQLELQVAERTYELHQQADQLRELDQVKSRFVTNITHEFRTPLALIISPVEKLLQESRFDRPILTMVQRNADQLLRLINQLLDLSKLEANQMSVSLNQGNVSDFISQLVALFQRTASHKGITLTVRADHLPEQDHLFDADKWEKILMNLLSNALKFSDMGDLVTLTVSPVWAGKEMAGVQLQLTDTGIGIAPANLPHIFDRFYQADTSETRVYQGTGIGLALVKELTDVVGGTITVESQLAVGTTFQLTLPVRPLSANVSTRVLIPPGLITTVSQTGAPSIAHSVTPPSLAEKLIPRVLIVEDNDELREFLTGELSPSYHVVKAADGQAGWECTLAELPDIVITDVMMPRMNGYELTRRIKSHPDTDHIAVVMLTAKAALPSRIEGLRQGADDYLSKPFSIDELQLRLSNLITRQQRLGNHYRHQFNLPGAVGVDSSGVDSPARQPASVPALSTDPFLVRIYGLLDRHLDDSSISVDWLSDQLAMNRKTLYRKVQSLIQLAPADLIRQYRLRKAAELLKAGHNVAETADLVGFSTPSHFTIVFKETYQQTPTEFMANRLKNA
ncbi:hybrid sensor histidine kinase/response regulator transcription factor [Spirosoma jeollabukense]